MADQTLKPVEKIGNITTPEEHEFAEAAAGPVRDFLALVGEVALLGGQTIRTVVRGGVDARDVINQMSAVGVDSIWIVVANNFATGVVFSMYTALLALQVGFPEFVGGTIAYAFLNEMAPMLAGVALASRCGAAIAAEIGSMVVTEQVEALRSMAVSPVRYLVAPRVLAAMLMLPLLTVIADLVGIFGAYLSAGAYGVAHSVFLDSVLKYAQPQDMTRGLIKSIFFGFLVGLTACQQGLRTKGGAVGVGRATTSSVVQCVVLIFIADVILARILTQGSLR